jgi:hypothetical protein
MQKEAVVDSSVVVFRDLLEGIAGSHENYVRLAGLWAEF